MKQVLIIATALTVAIACTAPLGRSDEAEVASLSQSLFTESAANLWTTGDIPVCFQPAQDVWEGQRAAYDAKVATVQQWIEDAFETIPKVGLDFGGWDECPNFLQYQYGDEGSDKIEIRIMATGGAQAHGKNRLTISLTSQKAWVLHEIMHTLGFPHEHRRSDSPGGPGTWDEYTGDPIFCGPDDIMYDAIPGTPTTCHPDNARDDLAGLYLTKYDFWSLTSATNYCHCRDELSRLDKLGLEITYPTIASLSGSPVHAQHGFVLAGDAIVGFHNLRLHNDWFRRGALAAAFSSSMVQWWDGSQLVSDYGEGFAVPTDGSYSALWSDFAGRYRTSTTMSVDINPPKATAIVISAL